MAGENMANLGKTIIAGEVRPSYLARTDPAGGDPGGGDPGGGTGDVKGKNVKGKGKDFKGKGKDVKGKGKDIKGKGKRVYTSSDSECSFDPEPGRRLDEHRRIFLPI
jgi:hypothetical protein